MQTPYNDKKTVRPSTSVRLSLKRVHCDKTEEKSVQIYITYERTFSLVFWEEEWLVGATPLTWNFRFKIALRLKKVRYKVSLFENCQRQSCKAFISLTIRVRMIGGGDPLYLKFWIKLTALERNRRFSISFRS